MIRVCDRLRLRQMAETSARSVAFARICVRRSIREAFCKVYPLRYSVGAKTFSNPFDLLTS